MQPRSRPLWRQILDSIVLGPEPPATGTLGIAAMFGGLEIAEKVRASWRSLRDLKLWALSQREGVGFSSSGEPDWKELAYRLAVKHEQSFSGKRKGRPRELQTEESKLARRILLQYVLTTEASTQDRQSHTQILKHLSGNPIKLGRLHSYYAGRRRQSLPKLKKDLQLAKAENKLIRDAQSKVFGSTPQKPWYNPFASNADTK